MSFPALRGVVARHMSTHVRQLEVVRIGNNEAAARSDAPLLFVFRARCLVRGRKLNPAWRPLTHEVWAQGGAHGLGADGHVKRLSPREIAPGPHNDPFRIR